MPGSVGVYVPLAIVGDRTPARGSGLVAAIAVLAAGTCLYAWCVWDFARFGRGTPAPIAAPRKLVVRGPYRWLRNPMYLGVLTVVLGWALLFSSTTLLGYAASVALAFHAFIVLYEETHLRQVFGSEYDAYRARVRRWLPRPPRNGFS